MTSNGGALPLRGSLAFAAMLLFALVGVLRLQGTLHFSRSTVINERTLIFKGPQKSLRQFAAVEKSKYPALSASGSIADDSGGKSITVVVPANVDQALLLHITEDALRQGLSYSLTHSRKAWAIHI